MITTKAQLVAEQKDFLDYTTYVFKCLGNNAPSEYIICTRYPNWNQKDIKMGEIGFLTYEDVVAGIDTWYNGKKYIPYKYNATRFLKFIKKPEKIKYKYVI